MSEPTTGAARGREVPDLLAALQRSIDRARQDRADLAPAAAVPSPETAPSEGQADPVRVVLDRYFDFDVDPWDDHDAACPAPEDIWRLHRDLKAALTDTPATDAQDGAGEANGSEVGPSATAQAQTRRGAPERFGWDNEIGDQA